MGRAVAGVGAGLLMFLGSFGVLWFNEGRTDMSKVAEGATITDAAAADPAVNGQLVSVSGTLESGQAIGDPNYLKPGNYLRLQRQVEMYAWVEKKEVHREKTVGGEEIERTEYNYVKQWTSHPQSSDEFYLYEGHVNPELTISEETFHAASGNVGVWGLDPAEAKLPPSEPVTLTAEQLKLPRGKKARRRIKTNDEYYMIGWGTLAEPHIGDVRLSWTAVPSGADVTVFAQADTSAAEPALVPYMHEGKDKLYRAVVGGHEEAIALMATEHKVMTWLLRIAGFLMMWIGMSLVFGPLHAIMDIIPVIGQSSRFLVGVALFPVALVLSILTIIVSIIAHSFIALMITLTLLVGGGIAFFMIRRRNAAPPTPEPAAA